MKFSKNDPILTTYALGELPDGEDKRALEAALKDNAELRAAVDAIRAEADVLAQALAAEPLPELSPEQKDALLSEEATDEIQESGKILPFFAKLTTFGTAIAACFIAMVVWKGGDAPAEPSIEPEPPVMVKNEAAAAERTQSDDFSPEAPLQSQSVESAIASQPTLSALGVTIESASMDKEEAEMKIPTTPLVDDVDSYQGFALDPNGSVGSVSGATIDNGYSSSPKSTVSNEELKELQVVSSTPVMKSVKVKAPTKMNMPAPSSAPVVQRLGIDKISAPSAAATQSGYVFQGAQQYRDQLLETDSHMGYSQSLTPETVERKRRVAYADGFIEYPPSQEGYDALVDNAYASPLDEPLSTFSIDVDTASYANVRRYIERGMLPPAGAVRIEELVNYFPYDYEAPAKDAEHPFNVHVETAAAPWNPKHRLMKVGLKGYEVPWSERPAANLVFLIDVSGSMSGQNKLPLVKDALRMLVERLDKRDRVAVVVYAGASGLALPSTTADNTETILHALDHLHSGGSTNGGAGIELAYTVARKHFIEGANNRVVLCTDGDFNVGTTNRSSLVDLIEAKAKQGVFLSILGFGMGNYKDDVMEELSNKGNGNYAYIDSKREARKVLVEQAGGTLLTIAKDVKIQVEFNPSQVRAYRLIGYANRMLEAKDFNDDTKDAGEIGAGHTVTAFYEIIPHGTDEEVNVPSVDPLKYQPEKSMPILVDGSSEMATVKLRYKQPDADTSTLLQTVVTDSQKSFAQASEDFRFASAVAGFGMILRESEHKGGATLRQMQVIAREALGEDPQGHRVDFASLLNKVAQLKQEDQ